MNSSTNAFMHRLVEGAELDGFLIGACLHAGSMAQI